MIEDHGRDYPQVQCVRGQNRRKPGLRTTVGVGLPCPPHLPHPPILSWRRPVCDKKKAGGTVTSQQPVLSSGPCPVCARHLPQFFPRG